MKQKSRKYKRYIRKQIKKQLQTTAYSLELKIEEKEKLRRLNLSKALDDTLQTLKSKSQKKS